MTNAELVLPDAVLSTLSNERRRIVLRSLSDAAESSMAVDALTTRVAERLWDEDVTRTKKQHKKRVEISLHHNHLPKLNECGMIDYGAGTGRVRLIDSELGQKVLTLMEPHESQ